MAEIERIKTYVEGLDEHIEGGIPKGSVSLICGMPGSMKSSLAYYLLYHNARSAALKGLYVTLEQDVGSLRQQMGKLGMEHGGAKESLKMVDYDAIGEELKDEGNWLKELPGYVKKARKEGGADLLVIDSLDALYSLVRVKEPRREIYHFFKGLRDTGITSLLLSEISPGSGKFGYYGVEDFLSDCIIHLEFQKRGDLLSALERYLGIIKMRSTNHDTQYFPMLYMAGKFTVYGREKLELE